MADALAFLRGRFPELEPPAPAGNELVWRVPRERYAEVCEALATADGAGFVLFSSLLGVDRGGRLEVVLIVVNPGTGVRLLLTTELPVEDPSLRSVSHLWPGAAWPERETAELFGIRFEGHPNLARLLLDDDFAGFPLRKQFGLGERGNVGD